MSKKEEKLIKITFKKNGIISKKIKIPNKSEKKAITRAKSYLKEVKENNMNYYRSIRSEKSNKLNGFK